MNWANVIAPAAPTWARNTSRKSGPAAVEGNVPIYKLKRMATLSGVFKRILTLAAGVVLGVALTFSVVRVATAWNIFPNRDLSRTTAYIKDVMRLVNENYVDGKAAAYDKLGREAMHGMLETLDPHSE